MISLNPFSRRESRLEQVTRRLSAVESLTEPRSDADEEEIYERLQRLRYGSRDAHSNRETAG